MPRDLPRWLDGGTDAVSSRSGRRARGLPWPWIALVLAVLAVVAVGVRFRSPLRAVRHLWRPGQSAPVAAPTRPAQPSLASLPAVQYSPQRLPPAWAGPLPYPILIAGGGHLLEVTPTNQVVWQYPPAGPASGSAAGAPLAVTDAFFAPNGGSVVATAEHQGVVARIDYYAKRIGWRFGVAGQPGGDATHLDYPDDAHALPSGNVMVADIRNCRILTLAPAGAVLASWGAPQAGYCKTDLGKGTFGYPNGDAPQADGSVLVSFSADDHIALLSSAGKVLWDMTAPNLYGGFVSDAQLLPGGDILVCGYGNPGSVVRFNRHGVVWHYFASSGAGALSDPTTALVLPGGDVLVADSGHNRVVVVDPGTNQIVWQYATGLQDPEGIDIDSFRDWRGWLAGSAAGGKG